MLSDGLIVICMLIYISKPETIVDARTLKLELDSITLWPGMNNDICILTSKMPTLYQEIHSKSGNLSYTKNSFLTNVFWACLTTPTEKFELFGDELKRKWIMEEITDPSDVISKLDKMHKNMVMEGEWKNTNEKDTKVVALTTKLKQAGNRLKKLE